MVDGAEAAGRLRAGDGRQTALAAMEGDAFGDVDIGDAVAIGQAEGVVIADIGQDALDAPADHGFFAGVDQRHPPRLGVLLQHFHPVFAKVERDVRLMQEVVREIFLDHVALVAKADDEVVDAVAASRSS